MTTTEQTTARPAPELDAHIAVPERVRKAELIAQRSQYRLSSSREVGGLLCALAAGIPGGRFLELGSGVGVGSGWLLAGMDADSRLVTIESHERVHAVCHHIVGDDPRVETVCADADDWLAANRDQAFDFVFVDTTSAKFHRRDLVYGVMKPGAYFVGDDLLPNDTWTEDHPARVKRFRREIVNEPGLDAVLLDWDSGLVIGVYRPDGV